MGPTTWRRIHHRTPRQHSNESTHHYYRYYEDLEPTRGRACVARLQVRGQVPQKENCTGTESTLLLLLLLPAPETMKLAPIPRRYSLLCLAKELTGESVQSRATWRFRSMRQKTTFCPGMFRIRRILLSFLLLLLLLLPPPPPPTPPLPPPPMLIS